MTQTPNEKAEELIEKYIEYSQLEIFYQGFTSAIKSAKKCALNEVNAIIEELNEWGAQFIFEESSMNDWGRDRMMFWNNVKDELNK